jgi:thiol-disulfide isomerase/thioredoxin
MEIRRRAHFKVARFGAIKFCTLFLTASSLCFPSSAEQTFEGKLDGTLHIDPNRIGISAWKAATPPDLKVFEDSFGSTAAAFLGTFSITDSPHLEIRGAVVRTSDRDLLYVDLNRNGRFEHSENIPVEPLQDDKYLNSHARFQVHLNQGQYGELPVEVRLFRDGSGPAPEPGKLLVLSTGRAYVQGRVQVSSRSVLVRYEYDLNQKGVDVSKAVEWMDVNGDGIIDGTPGSPEQAVPRGKPPVFHIGNVYLVTDSVDLGTGRFVLRTASAGEFKRIDLSVGSVIPDFNFVGIDGKSRRLADVTAKYVLLDFWATWCAPCVSELPSQKAAYLQFHGKGFEILGMNGDDDPGTPAKLLEKLQISWPQARYDGELFKERFGITSWPTEVLIDANRKVVSTAVHGQELTTTLDVLLPAN